LLPLAILSVIAMALFVVMASFGLAQGRGNVHAYRFSALALLLAVHSLAQAALIDSRDAVTAHAWSQIAMLTWAVVLPLQLHFSLALAHRLPAKWGWTFAPYLPAVVAVPFLLLDPTNTPDAMIRTSLGWAWDLSGIRWLPVMIVGYLVTTVATQGWWWRTARTRRERGQALWVFATGALVVLLDTAFMAFNAIWEQPTLPRMPHIYALLWAAGYGIAVLRYRLMELTPSVAVDALLSGIQDLFLLVDGEGRIILANARSTTLLGHAPLELRGRRLGELAVDPAALDSVLGQVRAAPGPVIAVEIALRTRDGSQVPVLIGGAAVRDREGEEVGLALVAQDQRPMIELLKTHRLDTVGVLAGGIAHDFNNLLTAVAGYVELSLAEAPAGSQPARRLAAATEACQRAIQLTRQLLTFSRGGAPIRRPTSLAAVVRESAAFVSSGSRVRLDVSLPDDLWSADADPDQLSRVVQNLVLNAMQASPDGGTVRVAGVNLPAGTRPAGEASGRLDDVDRVRLVVSDDGPGIPPELQPRIFDPFFTTRPTGTGLGLAIAESIVQRHGGVIAVESRPGSGAAFRVDLPRALGDPAPRRIPTPSARPAFRRVLVMDDEPAVRQVATDMLAALGCDVETCRDGAEAVRCHMEARAAGRPFTAIVLDLTVPGGPGGAWAADELRRVDPDVRLIASSGYAEDALMAGFRGHGFDAVLPKPYSMEQLRDALVGGGAARVAP
jgi:PAS domain S-box-containing protein